MAAGFSIKTEMIAEFTKELMNMQKIYLRKKFFPGN